ncbi:MAG: sigma-70 family RNA polymerase sigma factor [Cyclobacteriaceae bacterium]
MSVSETDIQQLIGHLFRHEAGRMAAVLTRFLGTDQFEVAEDLVQDTLLKAMEVWRYHGVPENPSAWLYKVAKNKTIDFIRTAQRRNKIQNEIKEELKSEWGLSSSVNQLFNTDEIQDSVLRMMFACCHPSISPESQIALTLKTLAGLSTLEIADAFLTSEETIAKRIFRAKEKIKEENIQLDFPYQAELNIRLNNVLKVLYLLFNEGYNSSHHDAVIREDLCEEAMRLTYMLVQHPSTNQPKVNALIALMCLQVARFPARLSDNGMIILLQEQDRSKWNRPLIDRGLNFLRSSYNGDQLTEYHVEAAIASVHAVAPTFDQTNWKELLKLYELLAEMKPGPMVELNKAIAIGFAKSPDEGLVALRQIKDLKDHYLYQAAFGNFYTMKGEQKLAAEYFETAISKASSKAQKELLTRKKEACA